MRSIAILAALIAIPAMAQTMTIQPLTSAAATEKRSFALHSGGNLTVATINGAVKVTAWDRNEVTLTAEFKANSDGDHTLLEIDSKNNSLGLTVKHPKNRDSKGPRQSAVCNLELMVPRNIVGNINTVNGSIGFTSITGNNKANAVNGSITLEDVSGNLNVNAVNGTISGSVRDIDKSLDVSTVNGTIKVKLINPNGTVQVSKVNGSVKLNTPGAYDLVSEKNKVSAKFGSGMATLKFRTVNGSVTID
ncbi:MAG: hypothetical protein FWG12_01590 [Holophagaceae bacterium]|nr:hypothetical protein [Holophagaceae bacterium]